MNQNSAMCDPYASNEVLSTRKLMWILLAVIASTLAICLTGCATSAGTGGAVAIHAGTPPSVSELSSRVQFWGGKP